MHPFGFDALRLCLNQLDLSESIGVFLFNYFKVPESLLLVHLVLLSVSPDYFFPLDSDETEPFLLIVVLLLYLDFVILPLCFQSLNLQFYLLFLELYLFLKPCLLRIPLGLFLSKLSLKLPKPLIILLLLPLKLVSQFLQFQLKQSISLVILNLSELYLLLPLLLELLDLILLIICLGLPQLPQPLQLVPSCLQRQSHLLFLLESLAVPFLFEVFLALLLEEGLVVLQDFDDDFQVGRCARILLFELLDHLFDWEVRLQEEGLVADEEGRHA